MAEHSIVICGLPGSGKTTFLAALWHLVTAREIQTALKFDSLKNADHKHLNEIAARWRKAELQDRTETRSRRIVTMNLLDSSGNSIRLSFPDLSGEAYRRMWEERDCDKDVGDILKSGQGVLLFVHADRIAATRSVVEEVEQTRQLGLEMEKDAAKSIWEPNFSPTQVKLVDLLQMLSSPPLDIGPRRVAVILSAWDTVAAEGRFPEAFQRERLSLLDQYLSGGNGIAAWRVYGVSAQGGDFATEADSLRAIDKASMRIRLCSGNNDTLSHDLTEPLLWLM